MPDGDFFWNACRTYTAFSNRTVYTARYAFPSCDSTTSSTPGPSPFQGFAVGAVPPNCAIPRALPMSSLADAGKLKKSRLDDPTQCNGFSSVTSRAGGTVAGTGLRARCSPCAAANPVLIASDAEAAGRARGCSNCNQ